MVTNKQAAIVIDSVIILMMSPVVHNVFVICDGRK